MDAAFELFYCVCAVRQARLIKQHGIDISNVDQTSLQTVLTVVLLSDRPIFVLKKQLVSKVLASAWPIANSFLQQVCTVRHTYLSQILASDCGYEIGFLTTVTILMFFFCRTS